MSTGTPNGSPVRALHISGSLTPAGGTKPSNFETLGEALRCGLLLKKHWRRSLETHPDADATMPCDEGAVATMIKVLIADDDSGTCETLADILAAQGYEVRTVEDGRAALEVTRGERYNIAFIDQRMPGGDGLTVVKELRRSRACDDIYVITAYAEDSFVRQALASGADRVFAKPFDIPLILRTLNEAIGGSLARQVAFSGGESDATPQVEGLTRRELQVLVFLAQGKLNREIAAELTLSPRTVERHVGKILARLEVSSRAAAAAVAIRHRLV
jgi:DNA-binding NarL/FixJ family response regulator